MSSSSSITTGAGDDGGDSGSTSTITTETVTRWHELKVESYIRTKGGVGRFINSATFSVGGHSWYIRYYPNGNRDESADWVSLYLYLAGTATDDDSGGGGGGGVKARYKFTLMRDSAAVDAPPVVVHTRNAGTFSFWSTGQLCRGYQQFIKAAEMEVAMNGGSFRIRCDVTVMKETCIQPTVADTVIEVPPLELNEHLGALLDSKVGVDVTFDVGGELFMAHRYVLAARSSVLMAELFGPLKENTMSSIHIDDVEPRVFKALLHFIYTDSMPEIDEEDELGMAQHLLVAGDRYGMQRLKVICEAMLLKHIDTSVLATTLTLAEQHGCQALKEGCFKFLRSPGSTKAVVESDGFQHLRRSCPSLIEEMLVKLAP